jgi:hypothetical protein
LQRLRYPYYFGVFCYQVFGQPSDLAEYKGATLL